jgi:CSLREA domain-containing protein
MNEQTGQDSYNIKERFRENKKPKSKILTLRSFQALVWKSLALGLTLGLSIVGSAQATIFTVTKTADTADGKCDADCSLREAIIAANASFGADTIKLPAGTYTLSIVGTDEDASAAGDLDITGDISIAGDSATNTIIDAAEIDRIFEIDPTGSGLIADISQVTLRNGSAPDVADIERKTGGGIDNRGTLALTNVVISGNAAMFISKGGGGLYNRGTMTLTDTKVSDNTGHSGGGIGNEGILTVVGCQISGNAASGASGAGGGLRNYATGIAMIHSTTVSSNNVVGYNGGGIHNDYILELTNSTVSGNTARNHGGGIYNTNIASLASVTIANNQAIIGQGGGIYNVVEIQIETTILTDNIASGIANNCLVRAGGNFTDFGYNLEDADSCSFTATGDIVNTDPLLGPLKDNGGRTYTHALFVGSAAIDGGNPNGCTEVDGVTELMTDQRGFSRSVDGNRDSIPLCDIGAYEYAPSKAIPWIPLILLND